MLPSKNGNKKQLIKLAEITFSGFSCLKDALQRRVPLLPEKHKKLKLFKSDVQICDGILIEVKPLPN